MKFAIIKERNTERERLQTMLNNKLRVNQSNMDIDVYNNFDSFEEAYIPGKYSLVFLDSAELNTGIQSVLDYLCSNDSSMTIVLMHMPDFEKPEGPQYRFLEMPFSNQSLEELLSSLLRDYYRYTRTIKLKEGKENHTILTSDITYVNIENHFSVVHLTSGRTIPVRMTFGRLMELIDPDSRFLLCNRSFAVNMDKIRELRPDSVELTNDEVIKFKKPLLHRARGQFERFLKEKAAEEEMGLLMF